MAASAAADLTKQQCEEVLERNGLGRLGCYSPTANECYVVPVAYIYHPGVIYFALAPGQKLRYLTEHAEGVCFEVEEVHGDEDWQTVIVTGQFSQVGSDDHPLREPPRGALRKVFEIGLAPYPHDQLVLSKLEVRKMSGRHVRWLSQLSGAGARVGLTNR